MYFVRELAFRRTQLQGEFINVTLIPATGSAAAARSASLEQRAPTDQLDAGEWIGIGVAVGVAVLALVAILVVVLVRRHKINTAALNEPLLRK